MDPHYYKKKFNKITKELEIKKINREKLESENNYLKSTSTKSPTNKNYSIEKKKMTRKGPKDRYDSILNI
jgi:hypothetical protein